MKLSKEKMKAAILYGVKDLKVENIDMPRIERAHLQFYGFQIR